MTKRMINVATVVLFAIQIVAQNVQGMGASLSDLEGYINPDQIINYSSIRDTLERNLQYNNVYAHCDVLYLYSLLIKKGCFAAYDDAYKKAKELLDSCDPGVKGNALAVYWWLVKTSYERAFPDAYQAAGYFLSSDDLDVHFNAVLLRKTLDSYGFSVLGDSEEPVIYTSEHLMGGGEAPNLKSDVEEALCVICADDFVRPEYPPLSRLASPDRPLSRLASPM